MIALTYRHAVHLALPLAWLVCSSLAAAEPCRVEVVDQEDWPVPLVELRTVSGLRFVSDNAGLIALDAPELFDRETWFHVVGHGYSVEPDGFGFSGVRLTPRRGVTLRVAVRRDAIARRIGRLTGSGLFAESEKLGEPSPLAESGIVGCDSIQAALHRGKLFWIWGDTQLAHYPLGVFHATAATTTANPLRRDKPPLAIPLNYFRDERGRPRGVARLEGRGPTWLTGLVSLPDASGQPRLVASFVKVDPPLSAWRRGLCEWNEQAEQFEQTLIVWEKGEANDGAAAADEHVLLPEGHALDWTDEAGRHWALFGDPFPTLRVPATYEAWRDPTAWQVIEPPESLHSPAGEKVVPHRGCLAYSGYRKRWIAIFTQRFGKPSALGEIWCAEARSPLGPWGPAVKILSHENYTFYNPCARPEFSAPDSPHLFLEGTYTTLFAGASRSDSLAPSFPRATPRHDYNQVLYRLDLDDPALAPTRLEP